VILTLTLPISLGAELGKTSTTVVRRAVAQARPGSLRAVSAGTLTCSSGQVNVGGSVVTQNLITRSGTCAVLRTCPVRRRVWHVLRSRQHQRLCGRAELDGARNVRRWGKHRVVERHLLGRLRAQRPHRAGLRRGQHLLSTGRRTPLSTPTRARPARRCAGSSAGARVLRQSRTPMQRRSQRSRAPVARRAYPARSIRTSVVGGTTVGTGPRACSGNWMPAATTTSSQVATAT